MAPILLNRSDRYQMARQAGRFLYTRSFQAPLNLVARSERSVPLSNLRARLVQRESDSSKISFTRKTNAIVRAAVIVTLSTGR